MIEKMACVVIGAAFGFWYAIKDQDDRQIDYWRGRLDEAEAINKNLAEGLKEKK